MQALPQESSDSCFTLRLIPSYPSWKHAAPKTDRIQHLLFINGCPVCRESAPSSHRNFPQNWRKSLDCAERHLNAIRELHIERPHHTHVLPTRLLIWMFTGGASAFSALAMTPVAAAPAPLLVAGGVVHAPRVATSVTLAEPMKSNLNFGVRSKNTAVRTAHWIGNPSGSSRATWAFITGTARSGER